MTLEMALQFILFSGIFFVVIAYHNRAITIPDDRALPTMKLESVKHSFLIATIILFVLFSFTLQKQKSFSESIVVQWIAQQVGNQATAEELAQGITYDYGRTEIVYYSQEDARWKYEKYGKKDFISETGCGPTSLAMVISTFTNTIINPKQMADWSYQNGYCAEGSGSYHTLIENALVSFGLQVEQANILQGQKIADALSNGDLVIALMGKGTFTSSGHFIVLTGITKEGEVYVADPKSRQRSKQTYPLGLILSESKGEGLGPFWIIHKK
ncbi:C39 family peptidase [Lachnospiraceae bacterium 46-61]